MVEDQIPKGTTYLDNSAFGNDAEVTFSVDGGKTYSAPEKLQINGADGKMRPALAGDYTHIRWTVNGPLAPGAGGSVSFRARIK